MEEYQIEENIECAVNFLADSDIRNDDKTLKSFGGINNGYKLRTKRYEYVYHEITGYAISCFLNVYKSTGNQIYLHYAKEAADYLLQFQSDNKGAAEYGAICHSVTLPDMRIVRQYWSFDNAMILAGLADLYMAAKEQRYYEGALRVADWLINTMQTEDGSFFAMFDAAENELHHTGAAFDRDFGCLHAKHTIGLMKMFVISSNINYKKAAVKLSNWVLALQREDGAFWSNNCKKYVVTHAHCYAVEGLLYAHHTLGEDIFLRACTKAADWLISRQYPDGALTVLAADIMPRGVGPIARACRNWMKLKHCDETAQAVRIWLILYAINGNKKYLEAAEKALRFLREMQCTKSEDSNMTGGFYFKIDDTFSRRRGDMMYTWVAQFGLAAFALYDDINSPGFYKKAVQSLF